MRRLCLTCLRRTLDKTGFTSRGDGRESPKSVDVGPSSKVKFVTRRPETYYLNIVMDPFHFGSLRLKHYVNTRYENIVIDDTFHDFI